MAHEDIVQNLIFQLGQSQDERKSQELDARHARVDERTPEDMLASVRALAAAVNYYGGSDPETPVGDWRPMFPETGASLAELRARGGGRVPAHLALYLAFLELYQAPRDITNRITGRHMDFHYRDVLRLRKRGSTPDRAHVLLELKKGAAPVAVTAADVFTAGKGASGAERIYAPVAATAGAETVVNAAKVESLRSIYLDRRGAGTVRFAPVANSSNGVGGKLAPDESGWRAFGHNDLPAAEVGFAVASPVLRMREGQRRGTITLTLNADLGAHLPNEALAGAFTLYGTGEKGWIELEAATVSAAAGNELVCAFTLPAGAPALVDHSPGVHGMPYPATAPVVQVLLRPDAAAAGYLSFQGFAVRSARVEVEVSGVTSLALESDQGGLNPGKPFQPFGPQPTTGSRFMVGYAEALSKRLTLLTLSLTWKDAPSSFAARYLRYGASPGIKNSTFKATVTLRDGEGTELVQSAVQLFDGKDATEPRVLSFQPGAGAAVGKRHPGGRIRGLRGSGTAWGERLAKESGRASPVAATAAPPPVRDGFVTLSLEHGFLHAEYRKVYTETVVAFAKAKEGATLTLPGEPYTPTVQDISLGYRATSGTVVVSPGTVDDFADPDVQFFHRAPFGPMREHGYPRAHLGFVGSTDVPLLPAFPFDGELLVGVTGIGAGDSVSLLFQAAPASADPDLARQPVHWSVLCDNYWKPLEGGVAGDTTGGLLASGIVRLLIPAEATTTNTVLPAGCVWIRAAVARDVAAVSRLVAVAPNAVEVEFVDRGDDPAHLASALLPGSIARLRAGLAPVKAVTQPYASFGGALAEGDDAFRTRAAERIRHRGRCVTAWDYERTVLEAFPNVHRVKCIPHASERSWMAPGHVMLVVVPDLRDRNDDDPLRPRVDADTLSRIAAHVQARTAGQVKVRVTNARFQKVRLDFKVRFLPGCDFNHCREKLQAELIHVLSPWAFDPDRPVAFGGTVFRSALMDFVEERPYVDFATHFQMFTFEGETPSGADVGEARPLAPDTLLVSDRSHRIEPVP
jgi:hypothetical protein